ncbi:hypothetical protein ACIA5D_00150 [Actinoplanes sp. NPDC051513]|uniref:hypothetical protein n=1 Tax=Actinoplanes sp. NPDC051513 TaxID=3363908 RepID=UPI0037B5F281
MTDDDAGIPPRRGMVISVLTRQDVVVMDPDRFLAAARRAYRAQDPDITEDEAAQTINDVYDAVNALMDLYGSIGSDHPDVAAGSTPRRRMHGGVGLLPKDRVHDRPDGLSPAGAISLILLDEEHTIQDYGCFLPEDDGIFTVLLRRDAEKH